MDTQPPARTSGRLSQRTHPTRVISLYDRASRMNDAHQLEPCDAHCAASSDLCFCTPAAAVMVAARRMELPHTSLISYARRVVAYEESEAAVSIPSVHEVSAHTHANADGKEEMATADEEAKAEAEAETEAEAVEEEVDLLHDVEEDAEDAQRDVLPAAKSMPVSLPYDAMEDDVIVIDPMHVVAAPSPSIPSHAPPSSAHMSPPRSASATHSTPPMLPPIAHTTHEHGAASPTYPYLTETDADADSDSDSDSDDSAADDAAVAVADAYLALDADAPVDANASVQLTLEALVAAEMVANADADADADADMAIHPSIEIASPITASTTSVHMDITASSGHGLVALANTVAHAESASSSSVSSLSSATREAQEWLASSSINTQAVADLRTEQARTQALQEENIRLTQQLAQQQQQQTQQQTQQQEADIKIQQLSRRVAECHSTHVTHDVHEGVRVRAFQQQGEMQQMRQTHAQEMTRVTTQVETQTRALAALQTQHATTCAELHTTHTAALEAYETEMQEMKQQHDVLLRERDAARHERDVAREERDDMQQQHDEQTAQLTVATSTITQLQHAQTHADTEIATLRAHFECHVCDDTVCEVVLPCGHGCVTCVSKV